MTTSVAGGGGVYPRRHHFFGLFIGALALWAGALLITALLYGLARLAGVWWLALAGAVALLVLVVWPALLAVLAVLALLRWLLQPAVVYDGDGNPLPVSALAGVTYRDYAALLAARRLPAIEAGDTGRLPAIEAGDAGRLLPASALLAALADAPHILLAGRTGSGKSTLARVLLAAAIEAGDAVAVIDPHSDSNDWGITAIGAGRDYAAIAAALASLDAELTARYQALAAGRSIRRLTVVIDEVPALVAQVEGWPAWAARMGSEARKAGVRCILLSQSPLVDDLGLNSVMRRNFWPVALDAPSARALLRGLPASQAQSVLAAALAAWSEGRRVAVFEAADGLPAAADVTGVQPRRDVLAAASVWLPAVAMPALASGGAQTDRATLDQLVELIERGYSRDRARREGYQFDNADWSRARALAGAGRRGAGSP